ncbi:hypothetical protein [Vibrio agarivorans]|uniref:Uncharacterized protein n=1 Tax=Vibrio agarivorans TaxID=153622 RepID=A0ABT7Y4C1_9VIBR|nr:hypothetical protein [Vibrio agarivorans]MDN2482875.1 hypothetical protein [Vibrio agarivorans]
MKLTPLRCQWIYYWLSIAYLLTSFVTLMTMGKQLSPAGIHYSMILFSLYALALLQYEKFTRVYNIVTVSALVAFTYGGVYVNVMNLVNGDLSLYFSSSAWIIAVFINGFGSLANVAAFRKMINCTYMKG